MKSDDFTNEKEPCMSETAILQRVFNEALNDHLKRLLPIQQKRAYNLFIIIRCKYFFLIY